MAVSASAVGSEQLTRLERELAEATAHAAASARAKELLSARVGELEAAVGGGRTELLALRAELESARADAEHAKAKLAMQELDGSAPSKAAAAPAAAAAYRALDVSALDVTAASSQQELSRAQARIESLTTECAQLREQVEHMTVLLNKGPSLSSASTSPMKMKKAK